jgi:predicted ATPase/DNA-binding winged helix-turn-helix (wHTH) protein
VGTPVAFIFGSFRLVVQRRELLLHGIPVTLGQRAIEVLLTLVSRPGQLVTKDEIMAEVWPGVIVEENNLQVHISALRKALGSAEDAKSFLLTVSGRGYRFVAPVETESADAGPSATQAPASGKAAPAAGRRVTNLPQQLTSFIGRQQEIAQLGERLQCRRLVTLTGSGGIGKTRVAIEAGWQLADRYPDGVWLIELAPLQDAKLIASAIAGALGIELTGGGTVASALAVKHLLLILDNCEHVIGEAAALSETLLRVAPRVSILATSRERLAVSGETVVRLASLNLPQMTPALTAAQARDFEAVNLFVERARDLGEDWSLTDSTAPAVASICRRLDGIPLAIEMAVPRLRVLSLAQLADGLNERFRLLWDAGRSALPRHRTLEAVIDWSYALLSEIERALFCRLSIFAGSIGLEPVVALMADSEFQESQILDQLQPLIEKSLVATERAESGLRYRLLESNRDYALQKLGSETEVMLRKRHAEFFCARMARATTEWETTPGERWLARYGADIDELRAALRWAFDPQGNNTLAIDLVGYSHVVWGELGLTIEHRWWVQEALSRVNNITPNETVARLLTWHAGDVKDIDDPADYADALRAAELHAQLGNAFGEGQALLRAGSVGPFSDDGAVGPIPDHGEALLQKARGLLTPSGPTKTLARCLSALASCRLLAGDMAQARQLHEQALSTSRQIGKKAERRF